jgi:hypothetical protein
MVYVAGDQIVADPCSAFFVLAERVTDRDKFDA